MNNQLPIKECHCSCGKVLNLNNLRDGKGCECGNKYYFVQFKGIGSVLIADKGNKQEVQESLQPQT